MGRTLFSLSMGCALALSACDDTMMAADAGADGGATTDAEAPLDAAMMRDGGPRDGGPRDAGRRDAGTSPDATTPVDAGPPPAFTLQLLHASDGEAAAAAIDDLPRFAEVLANLRATDPTRTLVLSSGDNWIPGPWHDATFDASLDAIVGLAGAARADVAAMNRMGFQASAFGNHEFDLGPGEVYEALAPESMGAMMWEGASFPYLSANLTFRDDPASTSDLFSLVVADGDGPAPSTIARSVVITVDGVRFGIVGATTPTLDNISSPGSLVTVAPADDMTAALATILQGAVDDLTADGIDHVILLAHMQQISVERELAGLLRDVDIIVAGGSNTLLSDATDRLRAGDTSEGAYPDVRTSMSGEPVLVVNTDGNWRYVGRLVVGFDDAGVVLPATVDPEESGAYATDAAGAAAFPAPSGDTTVAGVTAIADGIESVLVARESNQFGWTDVYLEARRGVVRTEETNLGNLVCDAMLWQARQVDPSVEVALHNAGGIRASIGLIYVPPGSMGETMFLPPPAIPSAGKEEGEISQYDISTALAFNNQLVLLTLTRAELRAVLERSVAGVAAGATPGFFGQYAGIRFSYDATRAAGDRIRNAAIVGSDGSIVDRLVEDGVTRADPTRATIRVVVLNFLADCSASDCSCGGPARGGDGYPLYAPCLTAPARRDLVGDPALTAGMATFATAGTEQDAFAEYLAATHMTMSTAFMSAETPRAMDTRIQDLAVRSDTVFTP